MRAFLGIAILILIGCNNKSKLARDCAKYFPCEVTKSDTIINYSTYHDTLVIRKDCIDEIAKLPNIQIKSIEVKGDSLIVVSTHTDTTKEVTKTVKDSAMIKLLQTQGDSLQKEYNKLNETNLAQKADIMQLKGGKRAYIIAIIIESLLIALVVGFCIHLAIKKR